MRQIANGNRHPTRRSLFNIATPSSASAKSDRLFSDIERHWAKSCIVQLAQRRLIIGNASQHFRPDDPITRAEFATLMFWVFPRSSAVRRKAVFIDVSSDHWASRAVSWSYTRGLVSGYPNGTFRPDQPITRLHAYTVLVNGLKLHQPITPTETLVEYFADADQVAGYAKGAIAAATLNNLVVNYPDVNQFRPNQPMTRGEMAATLCRVLAIADAVPLQYIAWNLHLTDLQDDVTFPLDALEHNAKLVQEIQTRLSAYRLYPVSLAQGRVDAATSKAIAQFVQITGLSTLQTRQLDHAFADALLNTSEVEFSLAHARDRTAIYQEFLAQESGFNSLKLAFLDRGIEQSPFAANVADYPTYLQSSANAEQATSLGESVTLTNSSTVVTYQPFPERGTLPTIDTTGLNFLHEDILQACLCVGSWVDGEMRSHWLGKNALENVQFWSSTKFVPLLNVVDQANRRVPKVDVDQCRVRSGTGEGYRLYDLAVDMHTYGYAIASSNSIAAMLKQFSTPQALEDWVKDMTGNASLKFQGRYGDSPFWASPNLWDTESKRVILTASGTLHRGTNAVSAYDLTRLMAMLGWHLHLPPQSRFSAAQWASLEMVVRAMGMDTARYIDVAIERLGLSSVIETPVIISKLGFGRSSERNRTELTYTAFVQFIDRHGKDANSPGVLRSLSLSLLAAKNLGNGDREATELDARLAAEVTEILRRVVTQELA